MASGKLAFAQNSDDESILGNIVLGSQYGNPEQLPGGASGSLWLAEHGTHWCLLFARCADPRGAHMVDTWAWGITFAKKLWTSGDIFQRVEYFIGRSNLLNWLDTLTSAGLGKRTIMIL